MWIRQATLLIWGSFEITWTVPLIQYYYRLSCTVPLIQYYYRLSCTVPLIKYYYRSPCTVTLIQYYKRSPCTVPLIQYYYRSPCTCSGLVCVNFDSSGLELTPGRATEDDIETWRNSMSSWNLVDCWLILRGIVN